jgi:DNA-binding CsgD family transcriptional regulator
LHLRGKGGKDSEMADSDADVSAELERLAHEAYMAGRDAECEDRLTRAHQAYLASGQQENAARCAFWLGFVLLNKRDVARGSGWISRAERMLADAPQCVVHGYLRMPAGIRCLVAGDFGAAYKRFCEADEIGRCFGDRGLVAMALNGRGRALIRMDRVSEGIALLDEAMIAITAGELSPSAIGDVYCSVIEACHEIFDLRRAHEWTAALDRWCASQPDQLRFRGHCLVRRAEILQLHGAWPDALDEARRACEQLAQPPDRTSAAAFYQWAELLRLRGEFAKAEEMYRQAGQAGRSVQPGMSLLRLAQGQIELAALSIRNVLAEATERRIRSRLLPAFVEIMLAAHDVEAARAGADELSTFATSLEAPFLRAVAARARGATHLATGEVRPALTTLRESAEEWDDLEAPYELARTRTLIACACRELGDEDAANIEFDAARQLFKRLGASPDLAHVNQLMRGSAPAAVSGLSARELQVLRSLVTGKTNKAIADELCISEKTVARHISNIFNKLGLSSRAAATAYAYEHGLV